MGELAATDPRELIAQHAEDLREYARRVLVLGERLSPQEEEDRAAKLKELLAIGSTFRLTERELVGLVFRGVFRRPKGCDCPTCRTRRRRQA